ncbi:hypothetical protein ISN45_Aa08g013680 [Arabidopsis thaliana x Arabidopsis arenosa]|uniref:Uncharacterized protein n=1 Tax=Arabidopsis thaliana x Arabidopsis arenosa TaxID=1240361 RepID=A0A8T1XHW6_9BRAS|nr:hypothetical protein ISN45_Aa08g013680 [Arabidopsis thaliana x Arabidopsis arenosa]
MDYFLLFGTWEIIQYLERGREREGAGAGEVKKEIRSMKRYTVCTVFHIRPSHEIRNIDMNVVNWNQWSSRQREIS